MDREKADRVLEIYGKPRIDMGGGKTITFARQDNSTVAELEAMSDEDLKRMWKSYCASCHGPMACYSLGDLQMLDLIELELDSRFPDDDDLTSELRSFFDKCVEAANNEDY